MFKHAPFFFILILFSFVLNPFVVKSKITILQREVTEIICYPSNQLCAGGQVKLTLSFTPNNAKIQWFRDGLLIEKADQAIFIATIAGIYSATATNESEITIYPPVDVKDSDVPVASFTHSSDEKCATSPIRFISTSTGTDLVYNWNFGDPNSQKNNVSDLANPIHTFIGNHGNGVQSYKVKLSLTNKAGCSVSNAETVVQLNQTPSTSLTAPELTYYNNNLYFVACSTTTPYTFNFINKSSTANINYRINWGDKSPDFSGKTFQNINHTYLPGYYTLFYTVTGLKGCANTQTYNIYVGISPKISVDIPSNTICINQPLLINVHNITPAATNYKVTYSDGVVKTYAKPIDTLLHYFASSSKNKVAVTNTGTFNNAYTAVIEASNPCGNIVTDVGAVYVIDFPEKPVVTPNINICLNGTPVPLTAVATDKNQLTWYTDGTLRIKFPFAPTPPTNLAQTITYFVTQTNATGCESEASELSVTILPEIENNIIAQDQVLCFADVPAKISPTATITGGNSLFEYQWQVSYDEGKTWDSNLADNISYDYTPLKLAGALRYRRMVNSGPCSNLSNEVKITTQPEIVNFDILDKDQYIIIGNNPTLISAGQPTGGTGDYAYQWQKSSDKLSWEDVKDATQLNFQPIEKNVTMHYRRVTFTGACAVISNVATVFIKNEIEIPTAFTPNGDGFNDSWVIKGFEYSQNFRLRVYNRNGAMILNSKNYTWDGSYNGKQLPPGTYYYILTSNKTTVSGNVTIIL